MIFTADDFGKSELANRNILRLAEAGKLDRVSVMIDGGFSEREIEKLLAADVKLDIHFELIWQKRRRNLLKDNTLRQGNCFFGELSLGRLAGAGSSQKRNIGCQTGMGRTD